MPKTEIDTAFGEWFNSYGNALTFIETPFYAGWHARDHEIMLLREALITIADAQPTGLHAAAIASLQSIAERALGRPKSTQDRPDA